MTAAVPTISVALATYNGAAYLEEQLRSIMGQTLSPAEVVVYDDGSAPTEVDAIRAIVARFPSTIFVAGANVGITANFARAIAATRCPLVALSDQDDVWTPDHLAALYDGLGDADLVYGDMKFMDEAGIVSDERFSDRIRTIGLTSRDPDLFEALIHNSVVWGAASLFRRDLIAGRTIPDTRRYHDWWLSVLATGGRGVAYVDQVVVHHRIHSANSSHHSDEAGGLRAVVGSGRQRRRQMQAMRMSACLDAMAQATPHLTQPQRQAIAAATAYAQSLTAGDRRIWRTSYAWRRRRLMVPDASPWRQVAVALSKLL